MFIRNTGSVLNAIPQPLWAAEGAAEGGAAAGDTPAAGDQAGTPGAGGDGNEQGQNGSLQFDAEKTYADLEPGTREWLQKKGFDKDPRVLAKSAFEQEKMLGGSIKVPGKDATQEEKDAFYNKLGRPAKADEYKFTVPDKLPENLPYDGERAAKLKGDLHSLGLSQTQAAAIHDMYINEMVGQANGATEGQQQLVQQQANAATEALVKRWGPLDGDTAQANLELADRVFTDVPGGQEFLAELQAKGFVGEGKIILSEPIAVFVASLGGALFKEDNVLKGKLDVVGNPFAPGEHENLTTQMKLVKEDPDRARSLIAAAGKKPADFGL